MFGLTKAIRELTRAIERQRDEELTRAESMALARLNCEGAILTERIERLAEALALLDEETQ